MQAQFISQKKEMNLPACDECLWPSFHPKNSRKTIPRQNNSQKDNSIEHTDLHATLRANPCPKVTDPICRIPLSSILYQLEATHLGVLMRFIGTDRLEIVVTCLSWSFKERHMLPFYVMKH
jgi:hypothetical protein